MRARAGLALPTLVAAITVLACGEEKRFTASELVAEVNEHGAGLSLGEELTSTQEGIEIRAVGFEDADEHGGGTLAITGDDDAGLAEFERCESAASLICFRAENAVLFFEDEAPADDIDRIEAAVSAIAGD
jgi:hypothetical protein